MKFLIVVGEIYFEMFLEL